METQTHESTGAVSINGIDVGKLEKELAAMWQPAENEDGTASSAGTTRVCVLNLIVYAAHHEDRAQIDQLLDEVTEQTPSRAIILVADRAAESVKLEAYVSTRCQISSRGGKQVCGEQVTVEASGRVLETVSTAIEPLLIPDVPVFLWWKDIPHYEDKLFNRLVGLADRVVIDSLAFDYPQQDLLRLAEIIRTRPQFMRVSDDQLGPPDFVAHALRELLGRDRLPRRCSNRSTRSSSNTIRPTSRTNRSRRKRCSSPVGWPRGSAGNSGRRLRASKARRTTSPRRRRAAATSTSNCVRPQTAKGTTACLLR